jgi:hypothetical protein
VGHWWRSDVAPLELTGEQGTLGSMARAPPHYEVVVGPAKVGGSTSSGAIDACHQSKKQGRAAMRLPVGELLRATAGVDTR